MIPHGIQGWTLGDLPTSRAGLVVWGAEDTTDDVGAGRATAKALAAPFVLLPHAGHLSMLVESRRCRAGDRDTSPRLAAAGFPGSAGGRGLYSGDRDHVDRPV